MIHHTCVYIRVARDPFPGAGDPGAHAAKVPSPLEYIHMYSVSCMRWSILANEPIHVGECACPFCRMRLSFLAKGVFVNYIYTYCLYHMYSVPLIFRHQPYVNSKYAIVPWCPISNKSFSGVYMKAITSPADVGHLFLKSKYALDIRIGKI